MVLDLSILDNDYVATFLALFVALYGIALSRVKLPDYIRNLFNNNIFRVLFLSLLMIHNFDKRPHVAIAVAMIFVLTMQYIDERETEEAFAYVNNMRR